MISFLEAEPPAGTQKEMTSAPTLANLSEPVYRNVELEKLINSEKTGSELKLQRRKLTDQDMEIVAFRAVYTNTVSDITFCVIPADFLAIFSTSELFTS